MAITQIAFKINQTSLNKSGDQPETETGIYTDTRMLADILKQPKSI